MDEGFTTYTVKLKLLSSVITPFQADTLFGTICWGIALTEGDSKITEFLNLYKDKETVPLIISDGFIDGHLPVPLCKPLGLEENEKLINKVKPDVTSLEKVKYIHKIKKFREIKYLPFAYLDNNKECMSQVRLVEDFIKENISVSGKLTESVSVLRTSINRYDGRAMEGRLFNTDETFYNSGVTIYVKLNKNSGLDIKWLRKIFNYIEISGYGADKSTGKGQVEISIEEKDSLPHSNNPNAFISLSSFIPDASDPHDGYYEPILKYGKLGGHCANSPISKTLPKLDEKIGHNPFKKPLLMFRAGSTFKVEQNKKIKPYYGKIVDGVHWDNRIVHYGLAFPLGIRLE